MIAWIVGAALAGGLSGDVLRPAAGSVRGALVEDTDVAAPVAGRLTTAWGWKPLAGEEGLRATGLLEAAATVGVGRVRLGVQAPVWAAIGEDGVGRAAPGDLRLDLRVVAVRRVGSAPGFGLVGRVALPVGGAAANLGDPGVSGEIGVVSDLRIGVQAPLWLGVNAGYRVAPRSTYEGRVLDDVVWYRGGAAVEIGRGSVALEASGQVVARRDADPAVAPLEVLASGTVPAGSNAWVRTGLGLGAIDGFGAAKVRVLVQVGFGGTAPAP